VGCKLKGLKARKKIAQGKRSETSAALGQRTKCIQALKGRKKFGSMFVVNLLLKFLNGVLNQFLKDFNPLLRNLVADRVWNGNMDLENIPNTITTLIGAASPAKPISTLPV